MKWDDEMNHIITIKNNEQTPNFVACVKLYDFLLAYFLTYNICKINV